MRQISFVSVHIYKSAHGIYKQQICWQIKAVKLMWKYFLEKNVHVLFKIRCVFTENNQHTLTGLNYLHI